MRSDPDPRNVAHCHGMIWPEPGSGESGMYWMPLIRAGLKALTGQVAEMQHRFALKVTSDVPADEGLPGSHT